MHQALVEVAPSVSTNWKPRVQGGGGRDHGALKRGLLETLVERTTINVAGRRARRSRASVRLMTRARVPCRGPGCYRNRRSGELTTRFDFKMSLAEGGIGHQA